MLIVYSGFNCAVRSMLSVSSVFVDITVLIVTRSCLSLLKRTPRHTARLSLLGDVLRIGAHDLRLVKKLGK